MLPFYPAARAPAAFTRLPTAGALPPSPLFSWAPGAYPECFNGCLDPECAFPNPLNFSSCAEYVDAAVSTWLQLGGTRVDNSNSYHNQYYVAEAMRASGLPRSQLFLTSKVGPYLPLGHAEALSQFATTLRVTALSYVDLLLVHWPTCTAEGCEATTEPSCNYKAPTYDAKACRLQTWRAMVEIYNAGGARAIGVSNYNISHLQEIVDAGLPLPSVNQCPFNIWHSADATPGGLLDFCKANNITYNGYSPFAGA